LSFNSYGGSPAGRPGPDRGLQIPLRMSYVGNTTHAFVISIEGQLLFKGRLVSSGLTCTNVHFGNAATLATFPKDTDLQPMLFAPLSREAIRFIDEGRGRDDLPFNLILRIVWQEADEVPPRDGGRMGWKLGPIHWDNLAPNWEPVPSSTWKRCLEQMEYELRDVIEIPRLPLASDPALAQALLQLKTAEEHARDGDWRDVLNNCRLAFESISRYEAPGRENTKRGFDLLLTRAYPGEWDSARRAGLDALIRSVRDLCSEVGSHIDSPPAHPTRAEALLVLSTSAALVATLGRALSDAEDATTIPDKVAPTAK